MKVIMPVFFVIALLATPSFAANYALEIIQPRAGLNTLNRFYKAYPGLEYNVRLAVIGGLYPYQYSLTSAPSGMTINATTGVITWSNVTTSGSLHTVTARVIDSESTVQTVTWTITVTTSGFRFLDAINGRSVANGGTGTISNPWRSMRDWYEGNDYASKTKNSYAGEFLYYRTGTYAIDAYLEDSGTRMPMVSNYKPQVWLAYPGESPVLNLAAGQIIIYGGGDNSYFDGFKVNVNSNAPGKGFGITSGANNVTFRRNEMYGITNGYIGGNNSLIFLVADGVGQNFALQDNIWRDVNVGYGVLGYSAAKVLVENNTVYNIGSGYGVGGHPIGPKEGTSLWFVRQNIMYNNPDDSIGLQYGSGRGISENIEISYNLIKSSGGNVRINGSYWTTGGPVYIFRNTIIADAEVNAVTSSNGPFHFNNNVIVNSLSSQNHIARNSISDPSRLIISNNLTGYPSDNIVDSNGNLMPAYSSYFGTHGYQIGDGSQATLKAPGQLHLITP